VGQEKEERRRGGDAMSCDKLSRESEYQHHFISLCKQQDENQFCNLVDLNTDKEGG